MLVGGPDDYADEPPDREDVAGALVWSADKEIGPRRQPAPPPELIAAPPPVDVVFRRDTVLFGWTGAELAFANGVRVFVTRTD